MYTKKRIPNYQDYTDTVVITEPNRSYSIAELLQRVLRGQPFPMLKQYSDDGLDDDKEGTPGHLTDEQVEKDLDDRSSQPVNYPYLEFEDAGEMSKYREFDDSSL